MKATEFEYEAFISYRHVPLDTRVAKRIQRFVEGYRIPRQLRSPDGPKRLGRLFRDQDELPATSSLSAQIDEALRKSRFLIVVCSTRTSESAWVTREIERFVSYRGIDNVILALCDGKSDEVVPQVLRRRTVEGDDGQVSEVRNDPLAADLRKGSGRRFDVECLRIVAPLVGCGLDDLRHRQRSRRLRLVFLLLSIATVLSMAFSAYSLYQQRQITTHYRASQRRESEYLASEAHDLLDKGARYEAVEVALAALPTSDGDPKRPYVAEAENALAAALEVYPSQDEWRVCHRIARAALETAAFDKSGHIAYIDEGRNLCVAELRTGRVLAQIAVEDEFAPAFLSEGAPHVAFEFVGDNLFCVGNDAIGCFDPERGEFVWRRELPHADPFSAVAASPDGSMAALYLVDNTGQAATRGDNTGQAATRGAGGGATENGQAATRDPGGNATEGDGASDHAPTYQLVVIKSEDGSEVARFDYTSGDDLLLSFLAFDDTGQRLAELNMDCLRVMDVLAGTTSTASVAHSIPLEVTWLQDDVVAVTTSGTESCAELFDGSLDRVWQWSADGSVILTSQGLLSQNICVAGLWSPEDEQGNQVVITYGGTLAFLDADTGKLASKIEHDSPYVGADIVAHNGQKRLVTCLFSGKVSAMSSKTGADLPAPETEGFYLETKTRVGETRNAKAIACDDGLYLVVRDASTHAIKVYAYARDEPWPGVVIPELLGYDSLTPLSDDVLLASNDAALALVDARSLEALCKIELEELEGLDAHKWVSVQATSRSTMLICGTAVADKSAETDAGGGDPADATGDAAEGTSSGLATDAADAIVLFEVDIVTGKVVFSARVDDLALLGRAVSEVIGADGSRYAFVYDCSHLALVPLSEGADEWRFEWDGFISRAWFVRDAIVWSGQYADMSKADGKPADGEDYRDRLFFLNLADKDVGLEVDSRQKSPELDASVLGGEFLSDADETVVVSEDGLRLAAKCMDGRVRMYELPEGRQVWQTDRSAEDVSYLEFFSDKHDVLMQYDSGKCVVIDAKDGSVIAASNRALPGIHGVRGLGDSDKHLAWYGTSNWSASGVMVLGVDGGVLGVSRDVSAGVFVSADESFVIAHDERDGTYRRMPYGSLDELVEKGRALIRGRELSDSERGMYHLPERHPAP